MDPADPKRVLNRYPVPEGALIQVKEGDTVQGKMSILYTWDPYNDPSIIKLDGELRWKDLVPGSTLREELDESTGLRSIVVMADPDRELHPSVLVYAANRKDPQEYILAEGSRIILGSDADQITRAMDLPDEGNPWSSQVQGRGVPDQRGLAGQEQEGGEGQDGLPVAAGQDHARASP